MPLSTHEFLCDSCQRVFDRDIKCDRCFCCDGCCTCVDDDEDDE